MKVIPLTPDLYKEWDGFCLSSPDAWFWHTTDYLRYQLHYRGDFNPSPLSFAAADENGEWLAIVPLLLECHRDEKGSEWKELSSGVGSRDFPALKPELGRRQVKKVAKFITDAIDEVGRKNGAARVTLRSDPLASPQSESPVGLALLEAGFQFIPRYSQVVHLKETRERLWADVRERYRSMVNASTSKGLRVSFQTGPECTYEGFAAYRLLHAKDAGRVTRPSLTWDSQLRWLQTGHAVLARAHLADGLTLGFTYILCFKRKAYYMSACTEQEQSAHPYLS